MPRAAPTTLQILCFCASFLSPLWALPSNVGEESLSTCPYKTINYITHNLPQQCLATTRISPAKPSEASSITRESNLVAEVSSSLQQPHTTEQKAGTTVYPGLHDLASADSLPDPSVSEEYTAPAEKSAEEARTQVADNLEEESALESGNFLSFEEWKIRNLKRVGQSEQIASRNQADSQSARKRPTSAHSSLESLGDDGEIDIDFSGFVPGVPQHAASEITYSISDNIQDVNEVGTSGPSGALKRSKDAGTTCKERFNYASFDCAANILKTNKEAKNANTVLLENKDSYMLNQCTAQNKFVILELCNDLSIDTIVLANFEFFSSTFRTFRVSVSDFYPAEKWMTLGTYEARNTREVQAFLVENPLIWARYVRIEFLTHYGNEFYCPVSLVRIHGITMMEDYKQQELEKLSASKTGGRGSRDEVPAIESLVSNVATDTEQPTLIESEIDVIEEATEFLTPAVVSPDPSTILDTEDASLAPPASVVAFEAIMSIIESSDTCLPADSPTSASSLSRPKPASSARILDPSTTHKSQCTDSAVSIPSTESVPHPEWITFSDHVPTLSKNSTDSVTSVPITSSSSCSSTSKRSTASTSTDTSLTKATVATKEKAGVPAQKSKGNNTVTTSQKEKPPNSTVDRAKSGGTAVQSQPATPTMQESFFKSVQKRLQMLEANSSLSLQYIEDQSRALRDAFKKVEQRQLTRTTAFLDQLNHTVLNELRDFRQQYDQLWQSTVIELELQREKYERDNDAINARLSILADEVIFQRRMAILQMVLILVCLVLVLFSRGVINNYLELPLVQNVLARSPSSKWLSLSGVESSSHPIQAARPRSAHQLRNGILKTHRRVQSEDSITDIQHGAEAYSPPTPISDYGHSEVELPIEELKSPPFESDKDEGIFDDPEFDPSTIERPSTSPPILRVNGTSSISAILEASEEEALQADLCMELIGISSEDASPKIVAEDVRSSKHLSWNLPNP